MSKVREFRESLGLSQSEFGQALGGRPFSTISGWEIKKGDLPPKARKELLALGVRAEWLDGRGGPMLSPGIRVEVSRSGDQIKITARKAHQNEEAGIRQVSGVTIDGPGFIPGAENQDPPPIFPGISGQAVEDSVRVLAESLAQLGLSLPPDRFAKLCRMASELITAEQLLGKRGDTAEQAKKIVGEILSMVVKG